jgi:hypothetical protein
MRRVILFSAFTALCAWAIDVPRVGYSRDAQGTVRPVDGVAGNFLLGDSLADDVALDFAWNGIFGIRKTEKTLEWWDSAGARVDGIDFPAGDVVIGFDRAGGQTAWVYSNETQTLYEVSLDQGRLRLSQTPMTLATANEEILALAGGPNSHEVAVRRPEGIFIATFDGTSGTPLAEVPLGREASRMLLLADGSIVGIDGTTLWLRRVDGSEWSADTGATLANLSFIARDWIQAGTFALRTGSEPRLYQIPEAVQ